jgi:SAM-dependent methyltransferase
VRGVEGVEPRWRRSPNHCARREAKSNDGGVTSDLLDPDSLERRWAAGYEAYATENDMTFLAAVLPPPPARVLDVPCGHGRLTSRLLDQGYEVVAMDLSRSATSTTQERTGRACAARADMARLPVAPGSVDVVLCMGNSLLFADDRDTAAFLSAAALALRDDGRLVLHAGHRDSYVRADPGARVQTDADGMTVHHDESFDPIAGVRRIADRYELGGRTHTIEHELRLYTMTELGHLLGAAGLRPVAWHGDAVGVAPTIGSPSVLVVATRA